MPAYDYHCPECDVLAEVSHPMAYEGEVTHEDCGGTAMTKVITGGTGFIINGVSTKKEIRADAAGRNKYLEMGRRQAMSHNPCPDLIPNVQNPNTGEVEICDSWKQAEQRAKDWGVIEGSGGREEYRAKVGQVKEQEHKKKSKVDKMLKKEQ